MPERAPRETEFTNTQTCFFREPNLGELFHHFIVEKDPSQPLRVCLIGGSAEEAFSLSLLSLRCGFSDTLITMLNNNPKELQLLRKRGRVYLSSKHDLNGDPCRHAVAPEDFECKYLSRVGCIWPGLSARPELSRWGFDAAFYVNRVVRERVQPCYFDIRTGTPALEELQDAVVINNVLMHYDSDVRQQMIANSVALLRNGGYMLRERNNPFARDPWISAYQQEIGADIAAAAPHLREVQTSVDGLAWRGSIYQACM